VRVLIYAGTYDLACNFVGNDRVARDLEWHGQKKFSAQPLRNWFVNGQPAGETRAFGGLTFATLRDAGHQVRVSALLWIPCTQTISLSFHQVPHDSPVQALSLINRWLADDPL
jgi:hypothetical protein